MKDKLSWIKFFNSGDFHRRGSWGSYDEIKRVTEDFPNTEKAKNTRILGKLKKCALNIGAGKRLKCNRVNNPNLNQS